jgi:hypothetical protein
MKEVCCFLCGYMILSVESNLRKVHAYTHTKHNSYLFCRGETQLPHPLLFGQLLFVGFCAAEEK